MSCLRDTLCLRGGPCTLVWALVCEARGRAIKRENNVGKKFSYSAKLKAICMRTFQIGRRLLAPVLSDQGLARDYRGTRHKNTACYTALHFEHLSATGPTEDALRSPACTLSDACILATVADGRPSAGGAAGPCPGSLRSMIHSV